MFSVGVLLYGDYPELAHRVLNSLYMHCDKEYVTDIRVGLNAVSDATAQLVRGFGAALPVPCFVYREVTGRNVLKYPLMRKMLYDVNNPITASRWMWFDDDSYMQSKRPMYWWLKFTELWEEQKPVLVGSPYRPGYTWNKYEIEAIKKQRWYNGKDLKIKCSFMTGGWWAANVNFLAKWDYPVRELKHNGGDVLLGEICRQQEANMVPFKLDVAINANKSGQESKASRRGMHTLRPYEVPPPYDYTQHDFNFTVERL